MRQAEIVVDVIQRELLAYTHLTLAARGDPPTDGRHVLADVEIDPLNERRMICQPAEASTCFTPSSVPNTTRWRMPTKRRRQYCLTTCA
jgi:hypothetical protein